MKIGLFFSRDEGVISEVIDLDSLALEYSEMSVVRIYDDFFSSEERKALLWEIRNNKLDGIVLAGPSPLYYQNTLNGDILLKEIQDSGINFNQIAIANLREHVAFLHHDDRIIANSMAKALVDVAIARIENCAPIETISISPRKSVLIIGTTVGAFVTAQRLAKSNYKVIMIERGSDVKDFSDFDNEMNPTLSYVQNHPKVKIYFDTEINDIYGWIGDYKVEIFSDGTSDQLRVGAIIVAVGPDKEWISHLQPLVQIDTDEEGYFRLKDRNVMPVQTHEKGIVLIPHIKTESNFLRSEIALADSAVLAVTEKLSEEEINHKVLVTQVDEDFCGGCASCIRTCAFSATSIDEATNYSLVDIEKCTGCGNCVVACPTGARDLVTYPRKYILQSIDILSKTKLFSDSRILVIYCEGCGYPAADKAAEIINSDTSITFPDNILPFGIVCAGRIDCQHILYAFTQGFDGVIIVSCQEGHCHNIIGNRDMDRRMSLFREVLRTRRIDPERLRIIPVTPDDASKLIAEINEYAKDIENLRIKNGR